MAGITFTKDTLNAYANDLESNGYAYRSLYVELTTLKQAVGWLISNGSLSADRRIELKLRKAEGTDTYCWRKSEVRAMIKPCSKKSELSWLVDIIRTLALTGGRGKERTETWNGSRAIGTLLAHQGVPMKNVAATC